MHTHSPAPTSSSQNAFGRRRGGGAAGTWVFGALALAVFGFAGGCGVPEVGSSAGDGTDQAAQRSAASSCSDAAAGRIAPGGMNIVGGDIVMLPSSCKPKAPGWGVGVNGRHVLFANFEGVDVRTGDNAMENEGLRAMDLESKGVIELAPFAPASNTRIQDILKIQKQIATWYADMNVDVVVSRPLSGDYLMTAVGDRQSSIVQQDGVVGISPGDCKNNTETNFNYAFSGSLNENVGQTAVTIAHEAGHAYGLGHTLNDKDIMYPSVSNVDGFGEGEVADPGPCRAMQGDRQDSHKVLVDNLGARVGTPPGKDAPPTVSFLEPQDGASTGNNLTVAVKAESALGIDHVTLSISKIEGDGTRGGHPVAELRPPASSAQVKISVAGNYQLLATAYDLRGNVAIGQARISIATPTCGEPNDCAPGQRCTNNTCVTPPVAMMSPTGMPGDNLRPYGSACDQSSECKGGLCAITPIGQITHYCNPDRLCAGGLECVDSICQPQTFPRSTPKIGQLGGKCTRNQDCATGECSTPGADLSQPRYCTKTCDPDLAWACPATMSCTMTDSATGMKNRCVQKPAGMPGNSDGGGGCSLSGRRAARSSFGAVLVVLAAVGLRRRRRAALPTP